MAVFVEISKTNHLTYSPLNEKHNILYHRARHNVNERHVQKPWFDINPFLDERSDKVVKLDRYIPDHDAGIQPLESLSVVEDYFSEKPLMAKEFKIGEFWDFLFSQDWGDGYSIRVLEGRLYNLMMSVLINLTQSKAVVQHSTMAFAKNRRQKFSIYKHSKKGPVRGSREETLLLEFIYYGHSTKRTLVESENSSCGYSKLTTCGGTTSTILSSDIESSAPDVCIRPMQSNLSQHFEPKPPQSIMKNPSGNRRRLSRRTNRNISDSIKFSKPLTDTSLSRVQQDGGTLQIPQTILCKKTDSDFSSGSDDYRANHPHEVDLKKFTCTEKISYLGEFDLSDDSSISSGDENDYTDYGQQFYLGERASATRKELSAEEMLKKRKESYKNVATKWKEYQSRMNSPKRFFRECSELDVDKYLSKDRKDNGLDGQALPDEVPDLVEFIDILQRDKKQALIRKREWRIKNVRKKSKTLRPGNERFADEVGGVTDSQACRLHCYQADKLWKVMSETAKKKFLIEKAFQISGKPKEKTKPKFKRRPVKKKSEIPFVYVTTTSGITYLHPVSRKKMKKDLKMKRREQSGSPTRRRQSLVAPFPLLGQDQLRPQRQSIPMSPYPVHGSTQGNKAKADVKAERKFPKAKVLVSGMESPDFDSDEESDGLEDSMFDSKRLNLCYSLENIRKKKAQKKKESPTKQNIYKILKKYYRMQSILKAFSGPSTVRRKSSVSSSRGSLSSFVPRVGGGQIKRRQKKLPTIEDEKKEPEMVIGKLKQFAFLSAKRKCHPPCDEVDEPLFENYPMDLFRQHLERALDDFVVRREVVISDYTAKASVSITFTKKHVFTRGKLFPNNGD